MPLSKHYSTIHYDYMFALEIIPITSSILTESLTYFSKTMVAPGTLVTAPLRNKHITGIVLSIMNIRDIKQNLRHQNFKIKNISDIHEQQLFSPAYLKTIEQLKNYYLVNTGKLIDITYPRYITKNLSQFTYTPVHKPAHTLSTPTQTLLQTDYKNRIQKYVELATTCFKKNESIHIICPTVHQVKKIADDLKPLIDSNIHVLHGKTTKKKIAESYINLQTESSLIVSTANFIDIPTYTKKYIILEQDSSSYYYRATTPVIDMRLFVEEYSRNAYIDLIIADSVLRPLRFKNDTNHALLNKPLFPKHKLTVIDIHNKQNAKQTDIERIEELSKGKKFSPIHKNILKALQISIQNHKKVFCYVQKKGLAPTLVCKTCGNIATCPDSKTPYSLFIKTDSSTGQKKRIFMNPLTQEHIPAFDLCQFCKQGQLQTFGIGTNTLAEHITELFPGVDILICDAFHTKNDTEVKKIFKKFNNKKDKKPIIMIGTQKAIPYLQNIDTTYIISIDSFFSQMSYTSNIRALSLIKNLEEITEQNIYIQSRNTLSNNLPILVNNNFKDFVNTSLCESQEFKVHPYGTLIKINHICNTNDYIKLSKLYNNQLQKSNPHIQTKPYHKKNMLKLEVLLHVASREWNIHFQDPQLSEKLPFGERSITIEINPEVF